MKQALLIIDVQNDYFEGGKSELFQPVKALTNIKKVLKDFRDKKIPVIYIQHINIKEGATFFLPNTSGADIHSDITPTPDELVVVKHFPNSFLNTNLEELIKKLGIEELIVCGMMSHMCVDTTVRACMDYAIKVTLIHDCCTTKDLSFNGSTIPAGTVHNTFMASLNGTFATVVSTMNWLSL